MTDVTSTSSALPHATLAVLGHDKSGKSTLLGRFFNDMGALAPSEQEQLERERDGMGYFKFSRVWDTLDREKREDLTINMHARWCTTKHHRWTVIDLPGDRRYLKNTLTGLSAADCALLVLDAGTPNAFELHIQDNSLREGVNAQIKEHLRMLLALGIKQVIVLVNKMDACGYKQDRYDAVCTEMKSQMRKLLGNVVDNTRFVPVASLQGDNVISPSSRMPWYSGSTLLEALDAVVVPARLVDKPFRMPVQEVYRVGGIGTVVCGKIETGAVEEGTRVVLAPSGVSAVVKSIESNQQTVDRATAGDTVGLSLRGVSTDEVQRGMVVLVQETAPTEMAIKVTSFQARVSVQRSGGIKRGYCAMLDVHSAHVPCRFARLISKLDKKTGSVVQEDPEQLADKDAGDVEMVPLCPLFLDPRDLGGCLSRFVMRDHNNVVAVGVVQQAEKTTVHLRPGTLTQRNGNGVAECSKA